MSRLPRRTFLRQLAAYATSLAAAHLLAACSPSARPTPTPPPTPLPTPVPATPTPSLTATPAPTPTRARPAIIKMHPEAPSTVVHTHHPGVWAKDTLVPPALRQMLDASITALTGLADARAAWAALFKPQERIAIKVNTIRNSLFWTRPPLVVALTDCLREAGVPAEQIVIYDRASDELVGAGFAINRDKPGVRCYGTDYQETPGYTVANYPVRLSNILLNCDALINVPILKCHSLSGITFALKNHYGTFDKPDSFHDRQRLTLAIADLNALPDIRDRTRLIVGDVLSPSLWEALAWPYWREAQPGDAILMSHDPVAADTVGLQVFSQLLAGYGRDPAAAQDLASGWLKAAAERGVGTNDRSKIKVVELTLK